MDLKKHLGDRLSVTPAGCWILLTKAGTPTLMADPAIEINGERIVLRKAFMLDLGMVFRKNEVAVRREECKEKRCFNPMHFVPGLPVGNPENSGKPHRGGRKPGQRDTKKRQPYNWSEDRRRRFNAKRQLELNQILGASTNDGKRNPGDSGSTGSGPRPAE